MGSIKITRPRVICSAGVRSSVTAKFPFWHNVIVSSSRFEMANKNIISQTIPRLLGCLKTSGTNNPVRRRHIAEEGMPHGNCCGNQNLALHISVLHNELAVFCTSDSSRAQSPYCKLFGQSSRWTLLCSDSQADGRYCVFNNKTHKHKYKLSQ